MTFDRALAVAQAQGWEIVTADKSSGRIEATETTRWFGFTDDVVVRLTPWGAGTRVDVRSVSRTALGDLGRNARRIRGFLDACRAIAYGARGFTPSRRASEPDASQSLPLRRTRWSTRALRRSSRSIQPAMTSSTSSKASSFLRPRTVSE